MNPPQILRIEFGLRAFLKKGYIIRYESKAVVYHHHGIHHARDIKRSKSTLNVIKKITKDIINFDLPYSMLLKTQTFKQ